MAFKPVGVDQDGKFPTRVINALKNLFESKGLSDETKTSLKTTYSAILPPVGVLTYDGSGNITQDQDGTIYTYNGDGTVNTITHNDVTRTLAYNSDGTISAVA